MFVTRAVKALFPAVAPVLIAVAPIITMAQSITQFIDTTGDGMGQTLDAANGVAVDEAGNVHVGGYQSSNLFKIIPGGTVTELIDDSGEGSHSPGSAGANWRMNFAKRTPEPALTLSRTRFCPKKTDPIKPTRLDPMFPRSVFSIH